ncbi:MAG: extracellular solute-binding protein [Candidatus Shapirobacteria bacterium]|nr:extracellular solute-binding protein [Candidatus Shapirobacteria bacterium]
MPDQSFFPSKDLTSSFPAEEKETSLPPKEEKPLVENDFPQPSYQAQPIFPETNNSSTQDFGKNFEGNAQNFGTEEKSFSSPEEAAAKLINESNDFNLNEKPKFGFKKILTILLILIILVFGGFAVFKLLIPRLQKQKQITLTYWGLWEPENVMKEIISEWESKNPNIKISYSQQSPKEYRERLQSALARNEGPDIFRFHITWLPMLKNELQAVPTEVMSATEFENTFYPVAKENLRSGTSFLGLPLEIDNLALFYNQQIFQAAGKTPPTTWDQLRQLALDLTVRDESGRIQTAGVALGNTSNVDHWSDILGLMMLQNGVDLSQPTGNLAEDALTFYTIFNNVDRVWDETLPVSTLAFATGKTAMYFGYSWDVFEIKNINPNLDFRVIPVPQLSGTDIGWASFWIEGIGKRSSHQQEAWAFLKFLSSKEELQKLYQAQSQVRLFGEPYARTDMASLLTNNNLVAPFINQAAKAKTWYLCSGTFDNGINDKMIKYYEDAVNALNGGSAASDILKTTSQGVKQLLSQYDLGNSK